MDLSRQLKSTALVLFLITIVIHSSHTRYHGRRLKRQNGAHMYLPESFIIPKGNSSDPHEWAPWSSPSECSRSCGGGVSYQSRDCLNFSPQGAPLCQGGNRKYFSCNTQDCPEDEIDFRAQQCSRFNNVPFEGVRYEWVPYTKAPNPCELNCMPRGERFYFRHKSKVIDGTRCNDESLDVCVDGECLPVGCDMMLGSPAREDKCRKCAGDGSTCRTAKGLLDMNNLQVGYNDLLLIPAGATNIDIQEIAPSNNYLGCRNLTGHYYLNGNWRIDFPRPMQFAGAWWHYDRRPQGFAAPDHITCIGPTTEAIYLVLLYQDRNVGIQYEYSIPESAAKSTEPDSYSWTHTAYGPCSASCGTGYQIRVVTCNSRTSLEQVDDSLCDEAIKPADTAQCGQKECAPRWVEGQWNKCSKPCGSDGKQERTVHCEKIESNGVASVTEDSVCLQQEGNKPATLQECNMGLKCPKWHIGRWRACDRLCGDGEEKRQIVCYTHENGKKKILPDSACPDEKPEAARKCMIQPCEGVDWITSSWSGCKKCGLTQETRTAICASKIGKIFNASFCPSEKPKLTRPCKASVCKYQWFTSEWSKCSAECGKGVQTRIVLCGQFDENLIKPAEDDSKCSATTKPEVSQECESEKKECPGQWFSGPWGDCDKPCGGGNKQREVLCMADGKIVSNCDEESIEFSTEKCNPEPCTVDETLPVNSTSKTIEEDSEELCYEDDSADISNLQDNTNENLELFDGINLDNIKPTETSLVTDELMQSDATGFELESPSEDASTDIPISTLEGSGDDVSSSSSSSTVEGSGDYDGAESTTQSSLEFTALSTDITELLGSSTDNSVENGSTSSDLIETTASALDSSYSSTETEVTLSGASTITETTQITISDWSTEISSEGLSASTDSSSSSSTESSELTTTDLYESSTEPTSSGSTEDLSTSPSLETEPTSESSSTDSTEINSSISTESSSEAINISQSDSTISSLNPSSTEETIGDSTEETITRSTDSSSELTTIAVSEETTDGSSEKISWSTETSSETTLTATDTLVSGSTQQSSEATTDGISSGVSTTLYSTDETTSSDTTAGNTEEPTSTVSGSTEESEATDSTIEVTARSEETSVAMEGSSTDSSSRTDETTIDIWSTSGSDTKDDDLFGSTPNTLQAVVTKEQTSRKCKVRKKKASCLTFKFGCCSDNSTAAKGPFEEGCPVIKTCKDTKHGCCTDGVSPAQGNENQGCPPPPCEGSLFGCCPDGSSQAEGEENEGCPEEIPTTTMGGCGASTHGCCPDGESEASGPDNEGCTDCMGDECTSFMPETTVSTEETEESSQTASDLDYTTMAAPRKSCAYSTYGCCPDAETEATGERFSGCPGVQEEDCSQSLHGCCPDNRTAASGPSQEGCTPCLLEPFGCCRDGRTPAHGLNQEGCCLQTQFGCCQDNINAARGPHFEGCLCEYSPYGCCSDNKTAARGHSKEGCDCKDSEFGCCLDKVTPAKAAQFDGCPCHTFQFGCCPDGTTIAQGPHSYGCHCSQSKFKCCSDEKTPAKGPNYEGCTCLTSKYGCCPDGVIDAQGENFEGCSNVKVAPQKACSLKKDTGLCSNYTVKHFYDTEYGGCSRFWYGGCDGNGNRFDSSEECKRTCEEPSGKSSCLLPKVAGPCPGYYKKYYYDEERKSCAEFIYGGCLGNNNKFDTIEDCQSMCAVDESLPPCEQPVDRGPCEGNYERWSYDNETDVCLPFSYGGCKGNKNNYPTEMSCQYHCRHPGVHKDTTDNQVDPGELRTTKPNHCETYLEECRTLHCPYGVRRSYGVEGCERCDCENPCSDYQCPEESTCAVDIASGSDGSSFVPVCRQTNKPGDCPILSNSSSRCDRECYTDADCRGDNKCCSEGCGQVCVRPMEKLVPTTTTPKLQVMYPGDHAPALEEKPQEEIDIMTPAGGYATLRCYATGNPPPTISWERQGIIIDTNQGRYIITSTGDLQIVQVIRSDSGSYVCIADNGIGTSVRREVQLQVTVPVSAVLRLDNGNNFGLGADIMIQCDVDGSPAPNVTWYKNDVLLEASNRIQITEQPHRLVIYGAISEDSGDYKCNAENSFSSNYHQERIMVQGVYVHPDCKDNPFFANCKLIVKGTYCSNHYYAKFCCRSCTLAGQIPSPHPNSI